MLSIYYQAMTRVEYHPKFERQLRILGAEAEKSEGHWDMFAEVSALLRALEDYGHDIEDYQPDAPSHPIVISRFETFALRRTPPTVHTPYAEHPPLLRIAYVWFDVENGGEAAVVMLMGDKTYLGNAWYPRTVKQIEGAMIGEWQGQNPNHRARLRGNR